MSVSDIQMRKHLFYWGMICMFLLFSCQADKKPFLTATAEPTYPICILAQEQTSYSLQPFIQLLEDSLATYTIQDITQPNLQTKFQPYPKHTLEIQPYKYYWGKVQLENRLANAEEFTEWVLSFSNTWTTLEIFTQDQNGTWRQEQNGTFTAEPLKKFTPTARGNLAKIILPPGQVVTIYFRGISERTAIDPSFYLRLQHIETFYNNLLKAKVSNAIFMGFLLMMFIYNLILYFYGRDRSFIFYSGYLLMMVIYSGYLSEDVVDWFGGVLFAQYPQYLLFLKLSIYLGMMCYLAFIRSFLDLEQLLPKWDIFYKIVIYVGFPLMLLDVIILLVTNFSYVVEDKVSVSYIILVIVSCCSLLYPLFKTRDLKGYFVIAGITALCLGALLTVVSRVLLPPYSLFYLKSGAIVEIIIFSLGLAYRLKQQKQAKLQADFKLKESQLIQEKKQIEADRLKELNEFKARFYTNITHEFRTPLTVIMGMSEQLEHHPKEKKLIQRNSKNLLRLINQLLDLSKLESGTLTLHKVHQDIIAYLNYLTESFYSSASQKNIRLVFHSEEKVVLMDYDEEKIQQIVYNLLSNALKFTPENGKIIFYASRIEQNGQPLLKLKIKDTGIGIQQENIKYIFDRFYQGDHYDMDKEAGTGIGLALIKELVELMQGRIEVESEVGEGTEFTLYLPIESRIEVTAEELSINNAPEGLNLMPPIDDESEEFDNTEPSSVPSFPELLIIEDNPDIITYIKTVLENNSKYRTKK